MPCKGPQCLSGIKLPETLTFVSLGEKELESFLWKPQWDTPSLFNRGLMTGTGYWGQHDCLSFIITTPCSSEAHPYTKTSLGNLLSYNTLIAGHSGLLYFLPFPLFASNELSSATHMVLVKERKVENILCNAVAWLISSNSAPVKLRLNVGNFSQYLKRSH